MNDILSLLDAYAEENEAEVARTIAADFRKRRIEKSLTRKHLAECSGVAMSNIVRFEQKALISLGNLIKLAMAMGYVSEMKRLFSEPKYSTMEELLEIRENSHKKKVYRK